MVGTVFRPSAECYSCLRWGGKCDEGLLTVPYPPCHRYLPVPEPEPYEAETGILFGEMERGGSGQ